MRPIRMLAVSFMLVAGVANAGARDELARFTKGLKGLDGRFSQQVFDTKGKLKETTSGTVALSAPRLFRWEYVKPYPQVIVADGRTVWIYEPDLQQVTKRPQGGEEQNSPLTALIDPGKLDRQFVAKEGGQANGLDWLLLSPKPGVESGFRSAKLGFDKSGLVRMTVVDALGQRTELNFSQWHRNPAFGTGTFRFAPPKGVDVIGG